MSLGYKKPMTLDLSRVGTVVIMGSLPVAGCYGQLRVIDQEQVADGRRKVTIEGPIKDVVICLRMFGMADEARSTLTRFGLPPDLYFQAEGVT